MINNIIKELLVSSLPARHIDVKQIDSLGSDCLTFEFVEAESNYADFTVTHNDIHHYRIYKEGSKYHVMKLSKEYLKPDSLVIPLSSDTLKPLAKALGL
ncbi:hypothetical protein HKB36_25955 [Vibrio parahaemolyticus]|uniref:hypothetical protein n=1 Tax=Vibrio parahaemolyticus TaxID=670 RepID=UPI00146BC04E|nr:hypothetical protein [Vibrio parahaemolyticus]MDF5453528.1 hypothetical protein [Vibrio parahaemolyticus]NMS06445.1 hypothetical protein [Vibrio parahaemolyticus]